MLNAYWTGVVFGIGLTVFVTGSLVETGVLPAWPGVRVGLVRSVGALVAALAIVSAVRLRQRERRVTSADPLATGAMPQL